MTPDTRCDNELGIGPCKICEQEKRMNISPRTKQASDEIAERLNPNDIAKAQLAKSFDPIIQQAMDEMKDITGADHVEIKVSENGTVVWINVNEVCVLRICRIKKITIEGIKKGE